MVLREVKQGGITAEHPLVLPWVLMSATIVVPHYKSLKLTLACLAAIAETTPTDHQVIVVDNGTGHDLPGQVIRNDTNRGFAVACNQGAAAADSPVLVFLNNDTEPRRGWLPPLLNALNEPNVVAVAPRLLNADGTLQAAGAEIIAHHNGQLEMMPCLRERARGPIRLAFGACLAMTTEAFNAVGGFDERYLNSDEDFDLSFKIQAAGWVMMYEPASVVMHHGAYARLAYDSAEASGPERFASKEANRRVLEETWGPQMTPDRTTSWWFLAQQSANYRLRRITRRR